MLNSGTWTTAAGVRGLLLGLAVGVLGSFTDDLLGGGGAVFALQLALWTLSAVILVPSVLGLASGDGPRADARRPVTH